jgi:hypothetical protein
MGFEAHGRARPAEYELQPLPLPSDGDAADSKSASRRVGVLEFTNKHLNPIPLPADADLWACCQHDDTSIDHHVVAVRKPQMMKALI